MPTKQCFLHPLVALIHSIKKFSIAFTNFTPSLISIFGVVVVNESCQPQRQILFIEHCSSIKTLPRRRASCLNSQGPRHVYLHVPCRMQPMHIIHPNMDVDANLSTIATRVVHKVSDGGHPVPHSTHCTCLLNILPTGFRNLIYIIIALHFSYN